MDDYYDAEKEDQWRDLNIPLFILIAVPAIFMELTGSYLSMFQQLMFIWVHEAGHPLWYILSGGSVFVGALGGTLNELVLALSLAFYFMRRRGSYPAACIMLLCAALSMYHAGHYMMSAEHPTGRGFGLVRMTENNHDFAVVFGILGVRDQSKAIATETIMFARSLAIILLFASAAGTIYYWFGFHTDNMLQIISPSAVLGLIYLSLKGASSPEILIAVACSAPAIFLLADYLYRLPPKKAVKSPRAI